LIPLYGLREIRNDRSWFVFRSVLQLIPHVAIVITLAVGIVLIFVFLVGL
jgi:hypothetical protein